MTTSMQQDVHLIDYLRVIHKRRWFVLFILAAALGGTAYQTWRTVPVYQSAARIMVENEMTIVDFPGIESRTILRLDTEMHIMRSREVAEEAVLGKLKLAESRRDPRFEPAVNRLLAAVSVKQLPNTLILELDCNADSPERAKEWCDAMADAYTRLNYEARKQATVIGARAITEEIDKAEKELELAESNFMAFKSENQIVSDVRKAEEQGHEFDAANTARVSNAIKRDESLNKYRALKDWYDKGQRSYLPPEIESSSPANGLYDRILQVRAQLREFEGKYTEKHPKVTEAKTTLRGLEEGFNHEVENTLAKLKKQADYYGANEQAHTATLAGEKRLFLQQNERDWQYNVLRRGVDSKVGILQTLHQKLEELNVATAIVKNNVRVIERPQYLPVPIRPRWRFNLLVGMIFGIGFGVAGAFFLEYLDKSLKTPDDVDRYLGLPVLAVIPKVRSELLKAPYRPPELRDEEEPRGIERTGT